MQFFTIINVLNQLGKYGDNYLCCAFINIYKMTVKKKNSISHNAVRFLRYLAPFHLVPLESSAP